MAERTPIQLSLFDDGVPFEAVDPEPQPPAGDTLSGSRSTLYERLDGLLEGRLGSLTLTSNRHTILTARATSRAPDAGLNVRIQRCFSEAPNDVLEAVAVYLKSGRSTGRSREALAVIRQWTETRSPESASRPRRTQPPQPLGDCFDLRSLRDELNERFFDGRLELSITWGRALSGRSRPSRRRVRRHSIYLGTWNDRDRLIRIHRGLDHRSVPLYVVESVVYHEMLHAAIPAVVRNGRRYVHTPEFRRRERLYPELERAERWIERHLTAILKRR